MRIRIKFQPVILALTILLAACSLLSENEPRGVNPLLGMGQVEPVASGFISTEGPVWHELSKALFFSDIPGNTIYALYPDVNEVAIVRKPSSLANGLALDAQGYLLVAEQQTRRISRMNPVTGNVVPYITQIELGGQPRAFNSPNDIAVHANGNIYFTDPPFGLQGRDSEIGFNGVYVREPNGDIELLKRLEDGNPNGIIFNPDQSVLYLAVSHDVSGPILAFDVDEEGNLSNEREFARAQNADGMAMDIYGNLYVATRTAVRVWSPEAKEWGSILLPGSLRTTNVAFGGEQMKTLYITNRSADIYAVELNTIGHQ